MWFVVVDSHQSEKVTVTYKFDNLAANNIFNQIYGIYVGILDLAKDKHLMHVRMHTGVDITKRQSYHLRDFLSILILAHTLILHEKGLLRSCDCHVFMHVRPA